MLSFVVLTEFGTGKQIHFGKQGSSQCKATPRFCVAMGRKVHHKLPIHSLCVDGDLLKLSPVPYSITPFC